MIKADHKKWARFLFNPYIERLLKSNFEHFYLVGSFPQLKENKALLITPNHFSWWDGFFIDYAIRKFSDKKFHIMMLEEQLKRYWFFGKLGAYSINKSNALSIRSTIQYTRGLLSRAENLVVIYPQGDIHPFGSTEIKNGLKAITSGCDCYIVTAAFNIIFSESKKPDIYCYFGQPLLSSGTGPDYNIFKELFLSCTEKVAGDSENKKDLFTWK